MIKSALYLADSRARVFSVLAAYGKYQEWLPGCEQCVVVSTKGAVSEAEIILNGPRRLEVGLRFQSEQDQFVSFELTSSKDLKTYSGVYRLADAADGKGTVLFTEVELEARSIPKFLTDGMAKKSIKEAGAALKIYIEKLPRPTGAGLAPLPSAAPPSPRKRARRILQILKSPAGYRADFLGRIFRLDKADGNLFDD